jgi:CubicO group peptidase (beta-lactamase class C family)
MDALADPVERVAADTGFSSVVPVDRDGEVRLAKAYGLAHRGWALANTIATRFAIASGTKGLTALSAGQTMPDTDSGHQGCSG